MIVQSLDSVSGRKSFFLRGLGRNNSVLLSNFHPLSMLDVVAASSPKSSMSYLREYTPAYQLNALRSDIYKSPIALFISELLYRCMREDECSGELFDFICDSIVALDGFKGSAANFHLWFLVAFAARLGFFPNNDYSEDKPLFNIASASFVAPFAYQQGVFSPENSRLLHLILALPFEEVMKLEMSGRRRSAFSQEMVDYLSHHLGISINIKSLAILHEIFS